MGDYHVVTKGQYIQCLHCRSLRGWIWEKIKIVIEKSVSLKVVDPGHSEGSDELAVGVINDPQESDFVKSLE